MTTPNGKRYTQAEKNEVLRRIAPPENMSVKEIAEEKKITTATIYRWIAKSKESKEIKAPTAVKSSKDWSPEDKFYAVLETAPMTEEETAAYCRTKGIYVAELLQWKQQCISANGESVKNKHEQPSLSKKDDQKIKKLERELARKEKALAEAAALLVLQKKFQAIWSQEEED